MIDHPETHRRNSSASYHKLSRLLDSSIPLPGGFRIGLDGVLGLIPGVGDAAGGFLSALIIYQAYRLGVPKMILLRMLVNVAVDSLIGAIPILGDIFDFFWKANLKNASLLDAYEANPTRTYRRSAATSIFVLAGIALLLFGLIYFAIVLMSYLWQRLN
ncbi:DUF4112 domain-containing protein [Saccharophagus sp. K07]|jgi:hypothetical protein|uniref:DUF4112 domain-containing protein n=1 Tax=Saccharophagus sp. K07 TaxID=2283636 RepID=UPI0016524ECF|nr:DUF4112 domain-containing protein [Saccharophagus sp. K07]MBC6904859.1 DUF4112 domain-containing protein [Saccharophagus sp. K07]